MPLSAETHLIVLFGGKHRRYTRSLPRSKPSNKTGFTTLNGNGSLVLVDG